MNEMPRYALYHKLSGTQAMPDASVVHPDGKLLLRLNDHWFFATDCVAAYEAA